MIKKGFILCVALIICNIAIGQNKNEVDLKEFDLESFKDASPIRIKDSSILNLHLLGVQYGYGISNMGFSIDIKHKAIKSSKNYGIYYTYFHSLWNSMPYFGLHTGIGITELGYANIREENNVVVETKEERYTAIEIPFMTKFRIDFWKMRLMIGAGAYGYYLNSYNGDKNIPETTNKGGYGLIGSGGLAFIFRPLELHVDCTYKYALSSFLDNQIYSKDYWLYTHANQLVVGVGLYYRIATGNKKKR